jgi:uncharacterized protein YciI
MKDIRHLVIHHPGPRWKAGVPIFEQDGVHAHVAHFRRWLEQDLLEMGGPFLDAGGGGMMIPVAGLDEATIRAFATADPAVASGLLRVEIRTWLVGMNARS